MASARSADLEATLDKPHEIGELRQRYKPSLANLVAGLVIGFLLNFGAIAIAYYSVREIRDRGGDLPAFSDRDFSWAVVAFLSLIAFVLFIAGIGLSWLMYCSWNFHLYVGDHGFAGVGAGEPYVVLWHQIARVVETHAYERPPLLKGPAALLLPEWHSRSFDIHTTEGKSYSFDANSIQGHENFADIVKSKLEGLNATWEIVERHA